jgi:hypothetical protein
LESSRLRYLPRVVALRDKRHAYTRPAGPTVAQTVAHLGKYLHRATFEPIKTIVSAAK